MAGHSARILRQVEVVVLVDIWQAQLFATRTHLILLLLELAVLVNLAIQPVVTGLLAFFLPQLQLAVEEVARRTELLVAVAEDQVEGRASMEAPGQGLLVKAITVVRGLLATLTDRVEAARGQSAAPRAHRPVLAETVFRPQSLERRSRELEAGVEADTLVADKVLEVLVEEV